MKLHSELVDPEKLEEVLKEKLSAGFAVYLIKKIPAKKGNTYWSAFYLITFSENL